MPKPSPASGAARRCSFTALSTRPAAAPPAKASSRSTAPGSRRTGRTLVSHPTVRDRSTPAGATASTPASSRPWPSTSTTRAVPVAAGSPRRARPRATARWRAASTTSSALARTAAGTSPSTAAVVCGVEHGHDLAGVAHRGRPGGGATGIGAVGGVGAELAAGRERGLPVPQLVEAGVDRRPPRSPAATSAAATWAPGRAAGCRPTAAASQAAARSGTRMRHDTPSTTRWWATSSSRPGPVGAGVEPHRLHHRRPRRGRGGRRRRRTRGR